MMKNTLIALLLLIGVISMAQRKTSYYNSLGIGIDATYFNLSSEDVTVNGDIGWAAGLETRGKFRHFADLIFGVNLFNNNFNVEEAITGDQIDMNVIGAELKLLFAYKPGDSRNFSLEIGPAVSFNGEFKVKESRYEESIIAGDNAVTVESFVNTTPINFTGIAGFSAGTEQIRFSAHYHYAFLDALNGKNALSQELNGNMSYFSFGARFYF